MKERPVEILVFGTGGICDGRSTSFLDGLISFPCCRIAVGATFGWRLAQNPRTRVSVVCRSNYDHVKKEGIQMKTKLWGQGGFHPDRVVRSVQDVKHVPFDYVVCANKIVPKDKIALTELIRPAIGPTTALVSAQNGIDVERPLANAFNGNTILSAICYISCQQKSLGSVHQVSQIRPHAFHIGAYNHGGTETDMENSKLDWLVSSDLKFKAIQDVNTERWAKAIFNGSWNPITALTGFDTHQVLEDPRSLTLVQRLAEEIYEVAIKRGANLPADLPSKTIAFAQRAAPIATSMLQDARNGRSLEVEPVCGRCSLMRSPRKELFTDTLARQRFEASRYRWRAGTDA